MHVQSSLCCPAAFVIILFQSEFVDPYLTRLDTTGKVSHTDNHGLHLTQRRITHHRDLVLRFVFRIVRILSVIRSLPSCLRDVTLFLQLRKDAERYIEHILLGPHLPLVGNAVTIIVAARLCQFQRYLILIVIILVVGAKTNEQSQLVIRKIRDILLHGIGMHKHLQSAVLAQVNIRILIHRLRTT